MSALAAFIRAGSAWPCQADGKTPISTYDAYIRPLAAKVEAAGNPIYKNMKVVSVERDASGRVTGVKALDRKGVERVFSGRAWSSPQAATAPTCRWSRSTTTSPSL